MSGIKAEAAEEVEARDLELAVQIPGLTDESCVGKQHRTSTQTEVPAVTTVKDWATILGHSQV